MRDLGFWQVRTTMGYALRMWFHKRQRRFMGKVSIPCGDCASDTLDYHFPECSIHALAS